MVVSRVVHHTALLAAFALGTALLASDPAKDTDEALLRLRQAEQLQLAQKQKGGLKAAPKPLPADPTAAMPEGAIAQLGNTRLRHAAPVTCVVFAPDGRHLISGGQDGSLHVWDAATGESIRALGLKYTPGAVRFTHGGKRLAIVASDSRIHFLHPESLREESTIQAGSAANFAISPNGKFVAAIASTNLLTVSELETGLPKLELAIESPAEHSFAFHPNAKTIAVAERTGRVTLYKLAGGKPVLSFDHGGPVNGIAFRDDGTRVATAGESPTEVVKVWDLDAAVNGKIAKPSAEIVGASQARTWLGADRIAAASRTGAGIYDLTRKRWAGFVKGAIGEWAISPDETTIASADRGALRVRLWDLASGKSLLSAAGSFPDAALLAPTPDGKALFILAGDAGSLWPLARTTAAAAGRLPVKAIAAATGGGRLAVATAEAVLVYDHFDAAKGLPAKPARTLTEFARGPRSVAVSQNGKLIAYSGEDSRIVVADAVTGRTLRVLPTQTIGLALAFSPDNTKLAVLGRDGFVRLWPVEAPTPAGGEDSDLWRVRVQRAPRAAVVFSPDGKLVAATSATLLNVIDAATGEKLFDFDRRDFDDGNFQQIAFSHDSRLLLIGSAGVTGAIQVYEVATRSLIRRYATGFGAINLLGVFPDGSRVVSAGAAEVLTVWDLTFRHGKPALTEAELRSAWANLDALDGAKGYPAGRALVEGGRAGTRIVAAGLDEIDENQKSITRWVTELESEDFPRREAATKALLSQGFSALPAVQAAASRAKSAEVRSRAADILRKLTAKGITVPAHGLAGDTLRLIRAVQVLEDIGGTDARTLLTRIVKLGGPAGDEAKAALGRMKK